MTFDDILVFIKEGTDKIIDDFVDDVVDNANNERSVLYLFSDDVIDSINDLWDNSVDLIEDHVVDNVNKDLGQDEGSSLSEKELNEYKEIGLFFFYESFRRASYRIHSSSIALQLKGDEEEKERGIAVEESIVAGKNDVDNIVFSELALAVGMITEAEHLYRGVTSYKWNTKRDDRVRKTHKENEGLIFEWNKPPSTGHAGTAHRCRCTASAVNTLVNKTNETEFQKKREVVVLSGISEGTNPFKVLNESSNKIVITISGEIGDYWESENATFHGFSNNLHDGLEEITVLINSNGGDLSHGVAIYNTLKNHKANVITIVSGHAHSSASIVFMAGNERYMMKGSASVIHNPWSCMCGDYQDSEKYTRQMKLFAESILEIYSERMSISDEEIRGMLDREDVIISSQALGIGYTTGNLDSEGVIIKDDIKNGWLDNPATGGASYGLSDVRDVISDRRVCSLKGMKKTVEKEDTDMSRDRSKPNDKNDSEESKELINKVTELNAKLDISDKTNSDLKKENDTLSGNEKKLKNEISALEKKIESNIEKDEYSKIKARLDKAGVKAEGDDSLSLKRDALSKSGVSNPDDFEGVPLDSMFDYVMDQYKKNSDGDSEDSDEADEAYKKSIDNGESVDLGEKKDIFAITNNIIEGE